MHCEVSKKQVFNKIVLPYTIGYLQLACSKKGKNDLFPLVLVITIKNLRTFPTYMTIPFRSHFSIVEISSNGYMVSLLQHLSFWAACILE